MLVSVVVPMKDEEGSLPALVRELEGLDDLLRGRDDRLEVVLVDDGSEDGTADAARAVCAGRGQWRLLEHSANRGFGAALRTGVAATRGDVVVSYDADCAYATSDVVLMLDVLAGGNDVASATPFADGASHDVSALRVLLSRSCSFLYRLALRGRAKGIRTFTCAFRAYRGDLIRGLHWTSEGFLAAAEIQARMLEGGARVVEVPSSLRPRSAGVSKMRIVPVALGHLRLLVGLVRSRSA